MVSGIRDHALALACVHAGLPAFQGRSFDRLPTEVLRRFEPALVRSLDEAELRRAFREVIMALLEEVGRGDGELAASLDAPLRALTEVVRP
jgi:hypothetical protein